MTPKEDQDRIVAEIRADIGNLGCTRPHKACLYWAMLTIKALTRNGIRSVLQAGSLSWPIVTKENDDGVSASHFSYMWEESLLTKRLIVLGLLPEMHVWVGIPSTQEIVDVTTCYLKQQCLESSGMQWRSDDPPDYLWADKAHTPNEVYYLPSKIATVLAAQYIINTLKKTSIITV